jgi:hypothetical protein
VTTLDTVHDILGTLVARYRQDEVLTSVRQIPAREAKFRPVPSWVTRAALATKWPQLLWSLFGFVPSGSACHSGSARENGSDVRDDIYVICKNDVLSRNLSRQLSIV